MADDEEPNNGQTIGERAGEEPTELFPMGSLPGDKKTLRTLIRSGLPVEVTCSLMAAEVPMRDGLPDPEKPGRSAVSWRFHKAEPVAVWEDEKIVRWKVRVSLRPTYVDSLGTGPSGEILVAFRELLAGSPSEAGELLDQMQKSAADALTTA